MTVCSVAIERFTTVLLGLSWKNGRMICLAHTCSVLGMEEYAIEQKPSAGTLAATVHPVPRQPTSWIRCLHHKMSKSKQPPASCFVSSVGVVTNNYAHRAIVHELVPQTRVAVSPVKMTLPSLLTSVQIFDGSNISEAIVYSNRFSETLSSKLTELIVAQLLATLIFAVIAALVTAHGKFLLDVLDDDDNDNYSQITISKSRTTTKFRKADDPPPPVLDFTKLIFCICIDILGSANEAIPLAGEFVDVIYAPIAALLLRQLFAGSNVVALLEFTEEILPFTDVLPLATICWVVESFYGSSNLARVLRIGRY